MKCALIGYGYWGKILKKYIDEDDFFELIKIYDPIIKKGVAMDDILNDKDIECAFVCNPINMHYSSVRELLKSGKNIFCEKPLCKTLKETEELINLANDKNLCIYTDYIYTSSPSINKIKENINLLGEVLYCEAYIKQFGKFYKEDNVFEVLGVHMISAIAYILNIEIKIFNVVSKKKNDNGITEIGSLEFKAGNIKGIINCSLLEQEKERKIIFFCKNGNIIFNMLGETTVLIVKHKKTQDGYEEEIIINRKYDESNNIKIALDEFKRKIKSRNSNELITINVAKELEKILKLNKE